MPTETTNPNLGSGRFLSGQFDPNRSAEHETLNASEGALTDGAMLAKFTSGANVGKVTKFNPAGIEGSNVPYGLLYGDKANKAATQRVVVVVRDQTVNGNLINYPAAATDPQKAAAVAALKAAGLIIRF